MDTINTIRYRISNTGSFKVRFLKSMCLNNVKPNMNAINTKNQFNPFLFSIFLMLVY